MSGSNHVAHAALAMLVAAGCASVSARAPRTPDEVRARTSAAERRECTLQAEATLRTFWLQPVLSLSDPIVLGRGQFLGAPVVPRPCAPADRDSARTMRAAPAPAR